MLTKTKGFATFALVGLLASTSALAQQAKMAIGYPPSIDLLPAMVAADNGCLAGEGLDAELVKIPVVTSIPPALLSGSLQIGMSTATNMLPAVENGLDLVVVAGSSRSIEGNEGISIVSAPGKSVNSAKDVEGMTVGVPGIMSVGDLMFRKWLRLGGVDDTKVTFVEAPFPRMPELLKSGTVDAVLAAEPIRTALIANKIGELAGTEYYGATNPDMTLTFWIASGEWARANPKAIASFQKCMEAAVEQIGTDLEGNQASMKKYLNFSTDAKRDWSAKITKEDLDAYVEVAKEFDMLRGDIDTEKLIFKP